MGCQAKDELTGIYTYRAFLESTEELLEADRDHEYVITVWDIVQFKVVNDLYGMEQGDKLLQRVAKEIRDKADDLLSPCTYGRISSNMFACCIRREIYEAGKYSNIYDYKLDDNQGRLRVLMQGGCCYVSDRTVPVIKMCDRAILALNKIKGKYTETVSVYSEENREEVLAEQNLTNDFDRAIKSKEFEIYIQPIYEISSGEISAGEVLARWNHPKYGLLMPGRFIGVFEKNYLVTRLDRYMWEEACRLIRRMMDEGSGVVPLSINVSRTDLYFEDLCDVLIALIDKYDIPTEYLRIEITESAYMDNPLRLKQTVEQLKENGFYILMDDFGTGYSSLNMLKDLPFDILKIDKKLIDEVDRSEKAGNVVNAIVEMAHWLKMKVVAEGVETASQRNFLSFTGCEFIQGFYYAKPMRVRDFMECRFARYREEANREDIVDLDHIFFVENVRERRFFHELVGALAIFELDGEHLQLKRVNDAYCFLFDSSPQEIYKETAGIESIASEDTARQAAALCQTVLQTKQAAELALTKKKETSPGLCARIFYIGTKSNKPQFLFQLRNNGGNTADVSES